MKYFAILFLTLTSMAFGACNVPICTDQGGATMTVGSGGTLNVASGGTLQISGATVSATAAELNLLSGGDKALLVKKVALAAVRTAGGVMAWTPGVAVIVQSLVLNVTTASTGASTIDCGIGTNATTSSDTLIDGVSGATIAVLDDQKNAGTNGAGAGVTSTTTAVTCSEASGDVTGIAGYAYIYYHAL